MEKLRKAYVLDWKCSKRSYVLMGATRYPNQNFIIKLKNLGYLNFSTTASKCIKYGVYKL